ncbi:NUDIX hydrolase [Amycolatopsis sp. NPDC049868]|uniref:NUDIX hydrolase n=1 Tax=Amycolatopsis sp. NPDC049868 TaxID=3363934 RepID=UPI0037AB31DB
MAALPIRDRVGNTLVTVRFVAEQELASLTEQAAMPASLVVVVHVDVVLMMFDSWCKQWELPVGTREPGESARQAAVRELREETGIYGVDLTFAAIAEFDRVKPARRELLAVYRVQLQAAPLLVVNDEALGFQWWRPSAR